MPIPLYFALSTMAEVSNLVSQYCAFIKIDYTNIKERLNSRCSAFDIYAGKRV